MKKWEFKNGHQDAQIPYPYIKGGVVNADNCTDEIVDVIKVKFPQWAHNFVESGTQEQTEAVKSETGNGENKLDIEDFKAMLETMTVPKLKAQAAEMGLVIEGNPLKAEIVSQIVSFMEAKKAEAGTQE